MAAMLWGDLVRQEGLLPFPSPLAPRLKQEMGLPGLGWGEVGAEAVRWMIFSGAGDAAHLLPSDLRAGQGRQVHTRF